MNDSITVRRRPQPIQAIRWLPDGSNTQAVLDFVNEDELPDGREELELYGGDGHIIVIAEPRFWIVAHGRTQTCDGSYRVLLPEEFEAEYERIDP